MRKNAMTIMILDYRRLRQGNELNGNEIPFIFLVKAERSCLNLICHFMTNLRIAQKSVKIKTVRMLFHFHINTFRDKIILSSHCISIKYNIISGMKYLSIHIVSEL